MFSGQLFFMKQDSDTTYWRLNRNRKLRRKQWRKMTKKNELSRDYRMDNIKGSLIYLVVLGHLLELMLKNPIARSLYMVIYAFHMPLFVFTTGYYAKGGLKRMLCNIAYPYLVFQTLYLLFARYVLGNGEALQYTKPYWILWYLFAIGVWTLCMPLFAAKKSVLRGSIFAAAIVLAIGAGYFEGIGREYTLSRILVFLPFFLAGMYWHRISDIMERGNCKGIRIFLIIVAAIILISVSYGAQEINRNWMYEATSYARSHYGPGFRSLHMISGMLITIAAMYWIPNRKWKIISYLGQHTMPVFLFHGFVVKLLGKWKTADIILKSCGNEKAVMIAVITALGLVVLLASGPLVRFTKPMLSCSVLLRSKSQQRAER